jgi:hypothetical protein
MLVVPPNEVGPLEGVDLLQREAECVHYVGYDAEGVGCSLSAIAFGKKSAITSCNLT